MFDPCRECAVKHLSAALAYVVNGGISRDHRFFIGAPTVVGETSRAYVLLGEFIAGGRQRHYDLAVGSLVVAEDLASEGHVSPETAAAIRKARLAGPAQDMMREIARLGWVDFAYGHLLEARREGLSSIPDTISAGDLIESFGALVGEDADGDRRLE